MALNQSGASLGGSDISLKAQELQKYLNAYVL